MQNIKNDIELKAAIGLLEARQQEERKELVGNIHKAYQQVMPINIVKNLLNGVVHSNNTPNNLLNMSLGIGAEFLYNTLWNNKAHSSPAVLLMETLKHQTSRVLAHNRLKVSTIALEWLKKIRR